MNKCEKVIKGLECCHLIYEHGCNICPYYPESDCVEEMARDAIALLKAQEPVEPRRVNRYIDFDDEGKPFTPETYDCGNCGKELPWKANYCPECGRAVKWDD